MIDKEGAVHGKLRSNNIDTVQDFLRMLMVKPDELRTIVGDDTTDEMWDDMTEHAHNCERSKNVYAYSGANGTIYVDSIFGRVFKGQIDGVECPPEHEQDQAQTMLVRQLILEAYEHRHNLQMVDAAMAQELRHRDPIWISEMLFDYMEYEEESENLDYEEGFWESLEDYMEYEEESENLDYEEGFEESLEEGNEELANDDV